MAQTVINNGDSGLISRNAINNNFLELYAEFNKERSGTKTVVGGVSTDITFSSVMTGIPSIIMIKGYDSGGSEVAVGYTVTTTSKITVKAAWDCTVHYIVKI